MLSSERIREGERVVIEYIRYISNYDLLLNALNACNIRDVTEWLRIRTIDRKSSRRVSWIGEFVRKRERWMSLLWITIWAAFCGYPSPAGWEFEQWYLYHKKLFAKQIGIQKIVNYLDCCQSLGGGEIIFSVRCLEIALWIAHFR